ncbi:MAG: hypothetical protein H6830_08005 [Planctomycetes bacterium]|nr:hypothetical protein [Planctomycetota bacterium]MCB9909780.1 hypothetical protein [Planctomycetota bacterium]MCB9912311.1 hypothetical protein [Planctomycetota bacterium]HRV80312.1 hypothetical protein [Planctomycetota bacterium]
MDITNKTRKPLSLSLPEGKRLFLGPGKTGQITPKALEHPPIQALIEAGELELASTHKSGVKGKGTIKPLHDRGPDGSGGIRKFGDG